MEVYLVNPLGELRVCTPRSEDKDGEAIRKGLPHDHMHPYYRKSWYSNRIKVRGGK